MIGVFEISAFKHIRPINLLMFTNTIPRTLNWKSCNKLNDSIDIDITLTLSHFIRKSRGRKYFKMNLLRREPNSMYLVYNELTLLPTADKVKTNFS